MDIPLKDLRGCPSSMKKIEFIKNMEVHKAVNSKTLYEITNFFL